NNFSIDNGTTLLKLFNNAQQNGLDTRDWAPPSLGGDGTNDAFNQFSNWGVVNPVSAVDVRVMDVIGYDLIQQTPAVPEPSALWVAGLGALAFAGYGWSRRKSRGGETVA